MCDRLCKVKFQLMYSHSMQLDVYSVYCLLLLVPWKTYYLGQILSALELPGDGSNSYTGFGCKLGTVQIDRAPNY